MTQGLKQSTASMLCKPLCQSPNDVISKVRPHCVMVVVVKSQITTSHSLLARLLWSKFEYIYKKMEAINDADTGFLQDCTAVWPKG